MRLRVKNCDPADGSECPTLKEFYDETPGTTGPDSQDWFTTTTISWHSYMRSIGVDWSREHLHLENMQNDSIYVGPSHNQIEWMVYHYI